MPALWKHASTAVRSAVEMPKANCADGCSMEQLLRSTCRLSSEFDGPGMQSCQVLIAELLLVPS